MPKLICCIGLPASGKTTWARAQEGFVRVNKDDIRADLETSGWVWSRKNEEEVIQVRDCKITAALASGKSVISDDTNFAVKHQVTLEKLARQFGAEFEMKLFNTPVEECVRRDALRPDGERVGEQVILGMAAKYIPGFTLPPPKPVEQVVPDETLPRAIICDLDGTLALSGGRRGPYDHAKCGDDDVNLPILRLLGYYHYMEYAVVYMSGREEKFREPTERFLRKHECPQGPLYMRKTGDFRKDWVVKLELFEQHVRSQYNVEFCLDDRDQVVKMWRKLGLTCFQVAEGSF